MALIKINWQYLSFPGPFPPGYYVEKIVMTPGFEAVSYQDNHRLLTKAYSENLAPISCEGLDAIKDGRIAFTLRAAIISLDGYKDECTLVNLLSTYSDTGLETHDQEGQIALLFCPAGNIYKATPDHKQPPRIYGEKSKLTPLFHPGATSGDPIIKNLPLRVLKVLEDILPSDPPVSVKEIIRRARQEVKENDLKVLKNELIPSKHSLSLALNPKTTAPATPRELSEIFGLI
jgi:hypothetical protein